MSVVRLLLKAGADINKQTNDTSCSLFAGTRPEPHLIVSVLCDLCDLSDQTVFFTAVDGGHRDVVNFLLGEGAEVNRSHTESCWTCLHQAVYKV